MRPGTLSRTNYEKNKRGLCAVLWCTGAKPKNRTICHRCRRLKFRVNHPVRNAYNNLRTNAKRRGKSFSLTIEHFRDFCDKTNYISLRGRSKKKLQIDRIKNEKGYADGNIQALSGMANYLKYLNEDSEPLPF